MVNSFAEMQPWNGACIPINMFSVFIILLSRERRYVRFYKRFRVFCWDRLLISSSTFTLLRTSVSTLSSDKSLKRLSVIVDRSLFLINFSLLNDRSPVQFVTIKKKILRATWTSGKEPSSFSRIRSSKVLKEVQKWWSVEDPHHNAQAIAVRVCWRPDSGYML